MILAPLPYLVAFFLPYLFRPLLRRSRTAYVFLLAAAWALFAGMRVDIGGKDYFVYRDYYLGLSGVPFTLKQQWEPLFTALAGFSKIAGLDFHSFFALVSFLGCLPAIWIVVKRLEAPSLGLFVYGVEFYLYDSFVILRQNIAMGFGFLVLDALMDKKYGRAVALALIAAGFHYSGLFLLALPLLIWKPGPKTRNLLFGIAGLLGLLLIAAVAFDLERRIHSALANRLLLYVAREGLRLNPLNVLEVLALAWFFRARLRELPRALDYAWLIFLVFSLYATIEAIFWRLDMYFKVVIVLLIPMAVGRLAPLLPGERTVLAEGAHADGRIARLLGPLLGRGYLEAGVVLYFLAKIGRWLLLNAGGHGGFLPYRSLFG